MADPSKTHSAEFLFKLPVAMQPVQPVGPVEIQPTPDRPFLFALPGSPTEQVTAPKSQSPRAQKPIGGVPLAPNQKLHQSNVKPKYLSKLGLPLGELENIHAVQQTCGIFSLSKDLLETLLPLIKDKAPIAPIQPRISPSPFGGRPYIPPRIVNQDHLFNLMQTCKLMHSLFKPYVRWQDPFTIHNTTVGYHHNILYASAGSTLAYHLKPDGTWEGMSSFSA